MGGALKLAAVLVELAQAVAGRLKLLLVDDVTGGFGLDKKRAAMDIFEDCAGEIGCDVLLVVSDHASALRSVRVWQLGRGKLKLVADRTGSKSSQCYAKRRVSQLAWRAESACQVDTERSYVRS